MGEDKSSTYKVVYRLAGMREAFLSQPGRTWTTMEVARTFGISEDTAYRDLMALSQSGLLPLDKEGWYWQMKERNNDEHQLD